MKKYRIVELKYYNRVIFTVQKKFLFWWFTMRFEESDILGFSYGWSDYEFKTHLEAEQFINSLVPPKFHIFK